MLGLFCCSWAGVIVGAVCSGWFAAPALGGFGDVENIALEVWIQTRGGLFTLVYSGVLSYLLLKLVDLVIGLRVNEEDETMGLDIALHDERGYNL